MSKNDKIECLLDKINEVLEKNRVYEFVELMQNPITLMWRNLVAGIMRGLGIGLGFSIFGAISIYFLRRLVSLNLPLIGNFIAEVVEIVQAQLQLKP